jgi:hypothetical protein
LPLPLPTPGQLPVSALMPLTGSADNSRTTHRAVTTGSRRQG